MKNKFSVFILFLVICASTNFSAFAAGNPSDCNIQAAYANPDVFHFVVMGDRNGGEENGVFGQVISKVNMMCPAFVVSVGDNIPGYNKDANEVNRMWDTYDLLVKNLKVPFLKVPGNHDVTYDVMAEVYKKRFGKTYHHAIYKNVLFLFLASDDPSAEIDPNIAKELSKEKKALKEKALRDGITPEGLAKLSEYKEKNSNAHGGKISDAQFEYFKKVLEDNKNVRWTFVLMHKPLWKQKNPPENWVKLEKMLTQRSYTVIAGHEHINSYTLRKNRDYIVTATSGGGRAPDLLPGVYHHILWVTMDSNGPVIANLMADGMREKTDIRPFKSISTADSNSIDITDLNSINRADIKKLIDKY